MYTCTCICAPMCVCVCAKSLQSCLTLYNPMDCSLPGSSVHGFLQESTGLGCPFLRQGMFLTQGSNPHLLCLLHWHVSSLPLAPSGKLHVCTCVCVCVCECVCKTNRRATNAVTSTLLSTSWVCFISILRRKMMTMMMTLKEQMQNLTRSLENWNADKKLEKEMATHSHILAWRIPWTEKPGL